MPRQQDAVPVGLGRRGEPEFHCGNRNCRLPFVLSKRLRNPLRSLTCPKCHTRNVVRRPSRFLKCRKCGTMHVTKARLRACEKCGANKFEVINNDEFYRQKTIKFHEITGKSWRKGHGPNKVVA